MKNFLLCFITFFSLTIGATGQAKKLKDLAGNWHVAGEDNAGVSLQIIDSTRILLTYMGEKKEISDFHIDFTKSPVWFDFSIKDSSSVLEVKSLLQVIGENIIKWQLFTDDERPAYFSSTKGELLYLKKGKDNSGAIIASNN